MGGPNLEVFKFGMYIMFPIGIMYYFGTNLDNRFAVPDFWPKPEQTHTIPHDREEINDELERLKHRRLQARARRLAFEQQGQSTEVTGDQIARIQQPQTDLLTANSTTHRPEQSQVAGQSGWSSWFGWK